MSMFSFSFSRKNHRTVGLEIQPEGMAVVCREATAGQPRVLSVEFLDAANSVPDHLLLKDWVVKNKLSQAQCNVVLGPDDYQILLVEPPDVPWGEMRDAVRWRLRDLISMPVEQAVVDVFRLPDDGNRAHKKMVYVVVADVTKIKSIIELVKSSGLALNSIDIGELAVRNLAVRVVPEHNRARGLAVARIRAGSGSIFLYRGGDMYLARNFSLDYNAGLLDELPVEALALELQRSVDYYERQMGQSPPAVIYICGDNVSEDKVDSTLRSSLAAQVEHFDPCVASVIEGEYDSQIMQLCIGALGGALREEKAA